jgi:L-rhamnose isomerase/sugar isomerase
MSTKNIDRLLPLLNDFMIELPSWGFADTGTRFGKFFQDAAAIDMGDKLDDAAEVHRVTGACPSVATHVLWDFDEENTPESVAKSAEAKGVTLGAVNPNVFQDQEYKLGSFGNPDAGIRERALRHCLDSIEIMRRTNSKHLSLWFADGTNYPGQDNIRARKKRFTEALQACHRKLDPGMVMLVEYKPFEPAFYATDIADWGQSYIYSKATGPQAKVLVDTGHHYQAQNIEQIVAWLLDEDMLGGFHFNDRRYADDDLTLGSIDPYQVFRIFFEIHSYAHDNAGNYPEIPYMIDQSHNLKPKTEAMIQTVMTAQSLYAKAALVDFEVLKHAQDHGDIVTAENLLKEAFQANVDDAINQWREENNLPLNPLQDHRDSGYLDKAAKDRAQRRKDLGITQGGGYA